MQIDEKLIQGKIDIIENNFNFLDQYKNIKPKDFIDSFKDIQAVKYTLLEIIEACIVIASHLVSVNNFQRPKTYAELFEVLGNNKIINNELSSNLSNMARFRNLLVGSYANIDDIKVLKYVKEDLDNIKEFIKEVLMLI
jgi:uncharacterized protein YutE (UPF0331/DUF86 family)